MSNNRVEILTVAECRELLDGHHFGRFGFVDYVGVFPSIIPVNYLLDGDKIVIRTDAGSKLAAALRGAPVAFEVDGVDETHQVGWSVVVRGHAEEVTDEDTIAELRQTPLLAWHPRARPRYVRINASQVIGRRIKIADLPPYWWGN
jgi:nitroimidazol reductase NimA-like FMN-containing flavoprotein (pyridoxamine 5'-phosphate oxidase superfamily)